MLRFTPCKFVSINRSHFFCCNIINGINNQRPAKFWCPVAAMNTTTAPLLFQSKFYCATSTSSSSATESSSPSAASSSESTSDAAVPLTNEQRAAFCAPPTVVTSKNFEQLVMQSQLAMCLTYHVDNTRCRQYLTRVEETANEMNIRVRHRWLSLMTIDADRNPTLAGAFSIERVKLPITFFVYSGTIIDKVNGAVTKERLNSILLRFMEYYQEQKGVDLEDHGFVQSAKVESITEAASTQEFEGKLDWMLLSKERVWSNPKEAQALVEKAGVQSQKDLRELQDQVGLNVKKIDPSELFVSYYSRPAYIAAARIAFFKALVQVIDTEGVALSDAAAAVKDSINEYKHGMARPTVRAVACVAQLRLAARQIQEQLVKNEKCVFSAASASPSSPSPDEICTKTVELLPKWIDRVDVPGGLDGEFPQETMDEMLSHYRQLAMSVRKLAKAKQDESVVRDAKLIQQLVGDCIRATLQLFPDDQKCNVARSRFAAMMH